MNMWWNAGIMGPNKWMAWVGTWFHAFQQSSTWDDTRNPNSWSLQIKTHRLIRILASKLGGAYYPILLLPSTIGPQKYTLSKIITASNFVVPPHEQFDHLG